MKLFALARLSTCVLLCLSPVLLGHCGGATNTGEQGTETGNPPRVDTQKLRLVSNAARAELMGEPGAVSPGASVRLDNRSTGVSAEVTASGDGSFRVELPGASADTYEVTVTHQGGTVMLSVSVAPDMETTIGADPGALSCAQLENGLGERLDLAFAPAALGCTSDRDCVVQYWGLGCHFQCGQSFVLATQLPSSIEAAEQSIAPLCSEIERRGCERPAPSSCPAIPGELGCDQGTCRARSLDGVSCEELSSRAGLRQADAPNRAARSCTTDDDCTLVTPALSCFVGCNSEISVATLGVELLLAEMSTIEEAFCRVHAQRPCPAVPLPPCVPNPGTPNAVCQQGLCGIEFATELP